MEYIYIKLVDGIVKVFGSEESKPDDESMFYKRKSETENWGDFLMKEWLKSLVELKWRSKQDEIKTTLKYRNDNNLALTLEQCLKEGYREVTSLVDLEETDCKFPACTCTPSKCKERGFVVKFKESETQEDLWMEISNRIYNDSNEWTKIKLEFEIKRK